MSEKGHGSAFFARPRAPSQVKGRFRPTEPGPYGGVADFAVRPNSFGAVGGDVGGLCLPALRHGLTIAVVVIAGVVASAVALVIFARALLHTNSIGAVEGT